MVLINEVQLKTQPLYSDSIALAFTHLDSLIFYSGQIVNLILIVEHLPFSLTLV
jgi:hypothetical protein